MTTTKTCALWNEQRLARGEMDAALEAQAKTEFPPGTRIRWLYSPGFGARPDAYREGVVAECWFTTLSVQVKPGGPRHRVPAHLADLLDQAATADAPPGVAPTAPAQPVAWRFRSFADGFWSDWSHVGYEPQGSTTDTFQKEPLFALGVEGRKS